MWHPCKLAELSKSFVSIAFARGVGLAGAGAGVHQRPCNGHVRLNISGIAYPYPVSYPYLLHIRIHAIRTYPYLLIWRGPLDL